MKLLLSIVFVSLSLASSVFAQEEILGKSKADALALMKPTSTSAVEGKNYPLIKETIRLEGPPDWITYLFIDSTDKVCRIHTIFNNLSPDEKQGFLTRVTGQVKKKNDLSDKKHATYTWNTDNADYLFTFAKDKDRRAVYLLVNAISYKQRMLNYLVNGGGILPDDGIFSPAPSK